MAASVVRTLGLVWEELDDDLVVFDPSTSSLHVLNPSAAVIWELCDGRPLEQVVAAVEHAFELAPGAAEADVRSAVERLVDVGLVVVRS